MRFSFELRKSCRHSSRSQPLHAQSEELFAGRICGFFDSASARPGATRITACGTRPNRDASGAQSFDSRATRALAQMAATRMLRAGDGAVAPGEIRAVGAGDVAGVAGGGHGAFHRERRAQPNVEAVAFEGELRLAGEDARREHSASTAGRESARGV